MRLTEKELEDLEKEARGADGQGWPRTILDLFDTIRALEAELAAALAPGPCKKGHPRKFWVEPPEAKSLSQSRRFAIQGSYCQICQEIDAAYQLGAADGREAVSRERTHNE